MSIRIVDECRCRSLFSVEYNRTNDCLVFQVKTLKMHMFTVIQLVLVIIIWIVKSTMAAIVFPLLVFLMAPLRLRILPKIFTHEELEVVSGFLILKNLHLSVIPAQIKKIPLFLHYRNCILHNTMHTVPWCKYL